MSNIYLKVTIDKKWRTHNFDFLSLKASSRDMSLGSSLNFQTSCCNLKIKTGNKTVCGFSIAFILKGIMTFKLKESMLFVQQKVKFNKNEAKSKTENSTPNFGKTNLVFQFV